MKLMLSILEYICFPTLNTVKTPPNNRIQLEFHSIRSHPFIQ